MQFISKPQRCASTPPDPLPHLVQIPSRFLPVFPPKVNPLPPHPNPAILNRAHHAQTSNPSKEVADMSAKYIFVTGGVVSSLGKGLAAASIGCLLEARGLKVNLMKFDPYLNVDPGTMSPFQHGEVFVTDDGAETDLDLGHYERFTHARLTRDNNLTTGRLYEQIIAK